MSDYKLEFISDRSNTHCVKYDGLDEHFPDIEGLIPMWIADMDIKCDSHIQDVLSELTSENLYGYYIVPDSFYDAFIKWQKDRHDQNIKKEWIVYCAGVLSGINWLIDCKTEPGDACLIFTPCYYPFKDCIRDTGRRLVTCELNNKNGYYSIDYDLFEKTIIDEDVRLVLFSSPHNPVARVWKKEELSKLIEICRKHDVFIVCDEIHQDIILNGNKQIPILTVGDNSDIIGVATAATKTFNLAGMVNSFLILPDDELRKQIDNYRNKINVHKGSTSSYVAIEAAYRYGGPWLSAVIDQVEKNEKLVCDMLSDAVPEVICTPMEGTYMQWIDVGPYISCNKLEEAIVYHGKVAANLGPWFFDGNASDTHIRLNLATCTENVERAVNGIIAACNWGKSL